MIFCTSGFVLSGITATLLCILLSFLPTGIEFDSWVKIETTALAIGLLNSLAAYYLIRGSIGGLSAFLAFFIVNTILFVLAGLTVAGCRLRWGLVSAFTGSLCIAIADSIVMQF